jgi:hypothetical protein
MKKRSFWFLIAAIAAACGESGRDYDEDGGSGKPKESTASGGEGGDSGDAAGQANEAGAPELGACDVRSEGEPCGVRSCDAGSGECVANDLCALKGKATRKCTDWICKAGECQKVDVTESAVCARDSNGSACGERKCPDWGTCSYGSTCSNSGTRSRTCSDYACDAGTCVPVSVEEADTTGCGRNTDGSSCGSTDCGSCSYANSCDETAQKWCTEYVCGGGSCSEDGFSSTSGCSTRDVCSPDAKESCTFWDADFCGPGVDGACSGQRTCSSSCGWGSCVRVTGGCFCP